MITKSSYGKITHQSLSRVTTGIDNWKCNVCGHTGTLKNQAQTDCDINKYKPCEFCGEIHTCAPYCAGILAILSNAHIVE